MYGWHSCNSSAPASVAIAAPACCCSCLTAAATLAVPAKTATAAAHAFQFLTPIKYSGRRACLIWAYTCGDKCQDTPCDACTDHFTPLPTDDTGSRPSAGSECPASRPHKTTDGCCGACRDDFDSVYAYDCHSTCSRTDLPAHVNSQCQTVARGFMEPPSPPPPLPMCDGPYDAGTANPASCGVSSVNDVKVSCSPTGCESGCPGFKEAGTPQVLCSSLPSSDSELNIGPIISGAGEQRPCNPAPLARRALPHSAQLAPRVACPAHSWRLAGALLHLRAGRRRHLLDHEEEQEGRRRRRRPGAGRRGPVCTGRRRR